MDFYIISDDYINYLKSDPQLENVRINKKPTDKNQRAYIGIITTINSFEYFIPLHSKCSHFPPKKFTTQDIIDTKTNTEYGTCLISNMIPVPKTAYSKLDIDNYPDEKYKRLLQHQKPVIDSLQDIIKSKAENLYKQKEDYIKNPKRYSKVGYLTKNVVVNFKLCEEKCIAYQNQQEIGKNIINTIPTVETKNNIESLNALKQLSKSNKNFETEADKEV